jgi:hypothetical protein
MGKFKKPAFHRDYHFYLYDFSYLDIAIGLGVIGALLGWGTMALLL